MELAIENAFELSPLNNDYNTMSTYFIFSKKQT